ncbi:CBS domain protein [compost metagenome]
MKKPAAVINIYESMESIMHKFDETKTWHLPVVDNGKYKGLVSKSAILNSYRKQLIIHSGK